MTQQDDLAMPPDAGTAPPKPRLILMGEFSSGKSTLSNILLGGPMLPTQVTATRLPPVHVSYGEPGAFAMTRDGDFAQIDLSDLSGVTPEAYRSLHLTMQSETLELCDLVDMPGISDPNMPADTWDSLVRDTDHVIWCTHATQAWRQSEAAAWERMREATSGLNLLLVTQFDKLRTPRDRARVLNRVTGETAGKFSAVFPVSLLEAAAAGDDFDAWIASGVHAFMERLVEILLTPHQAFATPAAVPEPPPSPGPSRIVTAIFDPAERRQTTRQFHDDQSEPHIVPRRVQAKPGAGERPRPPRPANPGGGGHMSDPAGYIA